MSALYNIMIRCFGWLDWFASNSNEFRALLAAFLAINVLWFFIWIIWRPHV